MPTRSSGFLFEGNICWTPSLNPFWGHIPCFALAMQTSRMKAGSYTYLTFLSTVVGLVVHGVC